jgi:hypothetical protein
MTWTEATSTQERWREGSTFQTTWDGGDTLWDVSNNVGRTIWDPTNVRETFTVQTPGPQTWTEQ